MAGLVPAIHVFALSSKKDVDARHKAGHDDWIDAPYIPMTRFGHPEGSVGWAKSLAEVSMVGTARLRFCPPLVGHTSAPLPTLRKRLGESAPHSAGLACALAAAFAALAFAFLSTKRTDQIDPS